MIAIGKVAVASLAAAVLSIASVISVAAQQIRELGSDLAFQFVCEGKTQTNIETSIEAILKEKGFEVLNRSEIFRQFKGRDYGVDITGLDNSKRMITFRALPYPRNRYAVTLVSRPPTDHSPELEGALLAFVEKTLSCDVRQITRSNNGIEARDIYASEVRRVEGLFRQADELRKGQPL